MLKYQEWKQLNESFGFGPTYTLGVKTPQAVGVIGSVLHSEEPNIEESKKKEPKKKMLKFDGEEKEKSPFKGGKSPFKGKSPFVKKDEEPEDEEEAEEKPEEEEDEDEKKSNKKPEDEEETEEEPEEGDEDEVPMFAKKCSKAKCKAKMKKEDQEWWNSVHNMLDVSSVNNKSWDGLTEDLLLSPSDETQEQPKPGEVGYAPQTRIGSW